VADVERMAAAAAATMRGPEFASGGPALDQRTLSAVFGQYATGITVVTAGRETPRGMTVNSFTSVSLDPALVLVCVKREAAVHRAIIDDGAFAISVLSAVQEQEARYFADSSRPRGAAEFASVDWRPGASTGAPVISGALAWLECRLGEVHAGGDHSIFLGEVLSTAQGDGAKALLFYGGRFRHMAEADA
jgi:flavin reductase (DIM6/NTAB) family NADH-FMN oxidoreductase RutF